MILKKRREVEMYDRISPFDRAPEPNFKKPYLHPEIDITLQAYKLSQTYLD